MGEGFIPASPGDVGVGTAPEAAAWRSHVPLPTPLTALLGREPDLYQLLAMLDRPETRLLTLMGPGGIGKTRLAIELAARMQTEYAHGVCFVPLAPVQHASDVVAAVATSLGVRESANVSVAEVARSFLADRHLLLVLDNVEHVVETAVPWIDATLAGCPNLTVLATSRVALRLPGEHRYQVPPLPVHTAGVDSAPADDAAVRLFVERATAIQQEFVLDAANAETVREICRRLDGMPLAIELAASRINVLPPTALLERLGAQIGVLGGGGRGMPARHQTMANAIAWSYDLLSPEEQRLFRRLSVFVGGFSLEAAGAVDADSETGSTAQTLDTLASLVDQSLIRPVRGSVVESRFTMLEPIREFGLEQLTAEGGIASARDAHAAWCLRLARDAEAGMEGAEQARWLNLLEREHDNLRGAVNWLVERERIEEAQDLTGSIWFFLWMRGHCTEGRQRYHMLLEHPSGSGRTISRAKALAGMATISSRLGDTATSFDAFAEAISILREHDDGYHLCRTLHWLSSTQWASGRIDDAESAASECLQLAGARDDPWAQFLAHCVVGLVASDRGDGERARDHWQRGADICRAAGNRWGLAICTGNLGVQELSKGETARAEDYWQEGSAVMRELGDTYYLPVSLANLAVAAQQRGDFATAELSLQEALTIGRTTGDVRVTSIALISLGSLASDARDVTRAVSFVRESIEVCRPSGNELVNLLDVVVELAIASGQFDHAARFIGATDATFDRHGMVRIDAPSGLHQRRLDAIVAALGPERFQEMRAQGKALSPDEALAEAMAFEPIPAVLPATEVAPAVPVAARDLTPRELEVLKLMAEGMTNQTIADVLFLSRRTVENHGASILGKLELDTRTGVVAYAIRNGLA